MANYVKVLTELQQERSHLNRAIQAIGELLGRGGRNANRSRRTLSAGARRKIAAAQRARWAKWKSNQAKKAA